MKSIIAFALAGFMPSYLSCIRIHASLTIEPLIDDLIENSDLWQGQQYLRRPGFWVLLK